MDRIRWGIVGCGDVAEVKSGPGFQKAEASSLVAVMRRDRAKAEDYAQRHNVPRVHATAEELIDDPEVDAVYIATPPSTHRELALMVASIAPSRARDSFSISRHTASMWSIFWSEKFQLSPGSRSIQLMPTRPRMSHQWRFT